MAAFVKGKLKAARDALTKKDFDTALSASREVLSFESTNYNALVFSGLALFELHKDSDCEEAYLKASQQSPDQPLAWQGLLKLYERKGDPKKTLEVLDSLLKLYFKAEDVVKTAESVQKIVQLQRQHGNRIQIIAALELLLPNSPYYSLLSSLPTPDPTQPTATTTFMAQSAIHNSLPLIEEIVALIEKEEEMEISKEVERRRMRLGSGRPEDVRNEVGCGIWGTSKLPSMYDEIINHPGTSDELRRSTEAKLFRYRLKYLKALSVQDPKKKEVLRLVDEMIRGMVLLEIPDDLVWSEWLESRNATTIEDYDVKLMRRFIELFPSLPLSQVVTGYFQCSAIPLRLQTDEDEDIEEDEVDYDTAFQTVIEGYNDAQNLVLPHRLLADLYIREVDYPNTLKIAEAGLRQVKKIEKESGRSLTHVTIAFQEAMATSLVHHFPPKNHPRALGIIEQVLAQQPENIPCLLGRAYILRYGQKYPEARTIFAKVAKLINGEEPEDKLLRLEAAEEISWCDSRVGDYESAKTGFQAIIDEIEGFDDHPTRKARAWWRLGKTLWDQDNDGSRAEAYTHFITSLKRDPMFAPAFTSLGIYYVDQASPPDPIRASKCFQKAVELDSREGDAARRLAEGFADEREWDLVEVVARRTIEGEGGAEGDVAGNVSAAARYKPVNAWAWKAIGVVELNRSNFQPAIISLQIALRADENDYKTWIRLGEAYSRSGRPAAALKALNRAHELAPDDWTCQFFTADVYRQMGLYETAIQMLEHILQDEKTGNEVGVVVALGESHLSLGRSQFGSGFVSRAEASWTSAIEVARGMLDSSSGFKRVAWKVIADSLLELSQIATFAAIDVVSHAIMVLLPQFSSFPQITGLKIAGAAPWSRVVADVQNGLSGKNVTWIAVAAYRVRIELCADGDDLKTSALYDYAVSLHSLSSKCSSAELGTIVGEANTSLKAALTQDPGNESYWNALGTTNFETNPKVSQHAFIKALELDTKNPVYWTSLGLLYLHHGDPELANHALYKAQVLNPEYSLAWVGQAFVAIINGHFTEAKAVLEHAITLPVPIPQGEYEYGARVFADISINRSDKSAAAPHNPDQLISAYFALRRYCAQLSQDPSGLHIFALLCERLHQMDLAAELLRQAIALLERTYEETEDPEIERRYAIANVNLGRVLLATAQYPSAKEAFDTALGLLSSEVADADDLKTSDNGATTAVVRIQAHFGVGLASFKSGELEEALSAFEASAEIVPADMPDVSGHVTIMTAQTLWAIGGDEAQDAAREQLLECIGNDSENLAAITTLAAIGILSGNDELVQASLSDILATASDNRLRLDPAGDVDRLLVLQNLHSDRIEDAYKVLLSTVQRDGSLERARLDLAEYLLQTGQTDACRGILRPSEAESSFPRASSGAVAGRENLHHRLRLLSVATSRSSTSDVAENPEPLAVTDAEPHEDLPAIRLATKSVMLAPWEARNWTGLAFVRTTTSS